MTAAMMATAPSDCFHLLPTVRATCGSKVTTVGGQHEAVQPITAEEAALALSRCSVGLSHQRQHRHNEERCPELALCLTKTSRKRATSNEQYSAVWSHASNVHFRSMKLYQDSS